MMSLVIDPCKPGKYITIEALHEYCGLPGICGQKLACEGRIAWITGYIDYGNVFDKSRYPTLPYQKFLITNMEHTKTMDVWVASEGSEAVFRKIASKNPSDPNGPVFVKGILRGFDMPIMGACRRDLKLELGGPMSISYEGNTASSDEHLDGSSAIPK